MTLYSRKASVGFASLCMLMAASSWAQDNPANAVDTQSIDDAPAEALPVAPPTSGKVVYKSVDSKGMVTFTDTAPIGRPSEAIVVQSANTMSTAVSRGDATVAREKKESVKYAVTITSPANEDFFGQEVESVVLSAKLEPDLREGDTFQLYYDGKPVADGATTYAVTTIERGTHTVEAKVFDSNKKLLNAADKVQFYIRRTSMLLNNKQNPAIGSGSAGGADPASGVKNQGGANGVNGSNAANGANGSLGAGSPNSSKPGQNIKPGRGLGSK